jgi:hypothetical protein
MTKSEKERKAGSRDITGTGETSGNTKRQFTVTTLLSIIAIIMAIVAAGVGAYLGVYIQNESKKQTTAKLIYDDIDRMNWSLNMMSNLIANESQYLPVIISPVYQDNGIYYSSRSDVALLDDNLARNISIFYADMQYAEIYRQIIYAEVKGNTTFKITPEISVSYPQFREAVIEAKDLRPQILNDLQRIYHISKSSPNRFNRF